MSYYPKDKNKIKTVISNICVSLFFRENLRKMAITIDRKQEIMGKYSLFTYLETKISMY